MAYEHSFYLAFRKKRNGYGRLLVRTTERQPNLESGEVAIRVTAKLPEALFQKPLLQASIVVPNDKVSPITIDAEVKDNIADVVRQNLGIDMHITVGEPE